MFFHCSNRSRSLPSEGWLRRSGIPRSGCVRICWVLGQRMPDRSITACRIHLVNLLKHNPMWLSGAILRAVSTWMFSKFLFSFFVLSGYFMARALYGKRVNGEKAIEFYKRRVKSVFACYWCIFCDQSEQYLQTSFALLLTLTLVIVFVQIWKRLPALVRSVSCEIRNLNCLMSSSMFRRLLPSFALLLFHITLAIPFMFILDELDTAVYEISLVSFIPFSRKWAASRLLVL